MTEKIFDAAFVGKLVLAMKAVEGERAAPANFEPPDAQEDDETIYVAFQERGGDAAAAKRQLAAAKEQCTQAFGRLMQFISDGYGSGPIERLSDATLRILIWDAFDAAENWAVYTETQDGVTTQVSPLRLLLGAHRGFVEARRDIRDNILWPVEKNIAPANRRAQPPRRP